MYDFGLLTRIDEICSILCIPAHTIPNKSHLGDRLGAFPIRGTRHPLSLRKRLCPRQLILICSGREGALHRMELLPPLFLAYKVHLSSCSPVNSINISHMINKNILKNKPGLFVCLFFTASAPNQKALDQEAQGIHLKVIKSSYFYYSKW